MARNHRTSTLLATTSLVAWVSHLPQFVATALSALLRKRLAIAELKMWAAAPSGNDPPRSHPYSMWRTSPIPTLKLAGHLVRPRAAARTLRRKPSARRSSRDEFEQANRFRRSNSCRLAVQLLEGPFLVAISSKVGKLSESSRRSPSSFSVFEHQAISGTCRRLVE